MEKLQIRKEIAALINSIKEHSENIADDKHIPQLELELILHKIEKLYEKSIVFNYLNSLPDLKNEIDSNQNTISTTVEPKVETKTEIKQEIVTPVDLFGSELQPSIEKPKAEKKVEKKEEKAAPNKIQKQPVLDLKSAIGFNDKFQFSNELFEGNMQELEIAIQQLNTAETFESAMEYYLSLQQLYNWQEGNETAKRLLDLVERRYT